MAVKSEICFNDFNYLWRQASDINVKFDIGFYFGL